jgi:alcohol dehydrogenase (cytochrome c)
VHGRQYLALQSGIGVFRAMTAVTSHDIYQPSNGQALYVFELPAVPATR